MGWKERRSRQQNQERRIARLSKLGEYGGLDVWSVTICFRAFMIRRVREKNVREYWIRRVRRRMSSLTCGKSGRSIVYPASRRRIEGST